MNLQILASIFVKLYIINYSHCYFGGGSADEDDCFCQLQGKIDDCSCNIDTVDHFNNVRIYPRLKSLLSKDYFRFHKLNLKKPCPFWTDDSRCAMRYCHVQACSESQVPAGLLESNCHSSPNKIAKPPNDEDHDNHLGFLDKTISAKMQEDIVLWSAYDDAQDNFCVIDENDSESEYVDLLLNPERFTGYRGQSAHRIWNSIYRENCFHLTNTENPYVRNSILNNICLEQRVFYRSISGLHSSINIHLCAKYLLSEISLTDPNGKWGHNLHEFQRRFAKESTNGEGPHWLRNLYFVYLLELRALDKAAGYLQKEEFYTGNEAEDFDTQLAVKDLLYVIRQFPQHFNESTMFTSGQHADKLKYEFKQHFRNVSRIMDCVGCDKCKLWGKLQIQGLGTALKILFSGKFDDIESQGASINKDKFQLKRSEIVSLINSLGKLSAGVYELDEFRQLMR